jgi:hypothetical protein
MLVIGNIADPITAILSGQGYIIDWREGFGAADGSAHAPTYPVVLLQDLMDQMSALSLFNRCRLLVADGGDLLILGEATIEYQARGSEPRPLLSYVIALAARCGFGLVESLIESGDLSYQARLKLPAGRAYFALRFRKAQAPRWQIDEIGPGDMPAVAELFQQVFGQTMSPELWRWKYGEGRGLAIAARRGGRLAAHNAGITRQILLFGKPERGLQICDVMAASGERSLLTRRSPFFLTAASLAEIGSAGHLIGFGFPNRRHMLLADHLGLYQEVSRIAEIHWAPLPARKRGWIRVRAVTQKDRHLVDRIWARMARDLKDAVVGVRDWGYLDHRYLRHPHRRYEVLLARSWLGLRVQGIIVLQQQGQSCELMDLIAPLRNIPALIGAARRIAGRLGISDIHCWVTQHNAGLFLRSGGDMLDPDVSVPTSIWVDGPPVDALKDRWWLMGGDTDFR